MPGYTKESLAKYEEQIEHAKLLSHFTSYDFNHLDSGKYEDIFWDNHSSNKNDLDIREAVNNYMAKLENVYGKLDEDCYKMLIDLYAQLEQERRDGNHVYPEDWKLVELDEDLVDYGRARVVTLEEK